MNVNFGLFPPPEGKVRKNERKQALTRRASEAIDQWIGELDARLKTATA